jgi:hypothetical protein
MERHACVDVRGDREDGEKQREWRKDMRQEERRKQAKRRKEETENKEYEQEEGRRTSE